MNEDSLSIYFPIKHIGFISPAISPSFVKTIYPGSPVDQDPKTGFRKDDPWIKDSRSYLSGTRFGSLGLPGFT